MAAISKRTFGSRRWAGLCLATVLGLVLVGTTIAQQVLQKQIGPQPVLPGAPAEEETRPNEFSHALSLPTDNKLQKKIEAAKDYISEESWGEAARLLQSLLDAKEDVFIQVARKDAQGQESTHWTSVRAEANRLLGTLPVKGREFYELQYGANARNRLDEAKRTGDPAILAEVAQRYLHTKAGGEATNLLGTYHLDRGRFVMAALCFERLLRRDGVEALSPATLLKAALAFQRTGDKENQQIVWKQLSAKDSVQLGERTVNVSELKPVLERFQIPPRELISPFDWAMYGGNPSRSAQGIGGAPFMEKRWYQGLIREKETDQWVSQAINHQTTRSEPILPAFFPIAATVRGPDGTLRLPLIVFRSHWGVHAVDLRTGKLKWESRTEGSLDLMAQETSRLQVLRGWINIYLQANPNLLYENSTLGTLSTDNSRVYAVEDLALPPHPQFLMNNGFNAWGGGAQPSFGTLSDIVRCSKLEALDLVSGKLLWEVGGPIQDGVEPTELNEAYFLGPPLPLAGKLYALCEKSQELKLVCLEAPTGKVNWTQTLATTRDKMLTDVGRRIRAASPAYADGILVCPTNAGAVLGVDLLSRSLVWAHAYREKEQEPEARPETPQQRVVRIRGMMASGAAISANLNAAWKATAPIIREGKVVFTAPDGSSVHCLDLRDGSLLWKSPRRDDLYLAGVYGDRVLLVGRGFCRALALADGKPAWSVETGIPSGQGIASDGVYYLPLREAGRSKEPEVCAIDIAKGVVVAHTKSRKQEVPGNLLFYEGDVVSQTATGIAAYPQLKVKLTQIDEMIAKNPQDPVGLTERGELRLDQGDLNGAISDLTLALANNPPEDVIPKTRTKLYETLTELLQRDFAAGEKYLVDYEKLCQVAVPENTGEDERKTLQEEQRRRQSNYLCLLAKGREKQGRLVDAFDAYMKFGEVAGDQELVSVIDEPTVKAPPDVWAQGRIAAMVAHASDAQRQPLEARIKREWDEVKGVDDTERLRRFVQMFGTLFGAGLEARLQLADRLMQSDAPNALLEAERHLLLLRDHGDRVWAARALDGLARLYTHKNLLEDAAYCYRRLGSDYADVVVRDGKTGADLQAEMATDKRFLPYLDEPQEVQVHGRIEVRAQTGNFRMTRQVFTFEHEGDPLPFFQRLRVVLDLNYHQLKLFNRDDNNEVWSHNLTRTNFQQYMGFSNNPTRPVRFTYRASGHLVVLAPGHMVFGIDPVSHRPLWEHSLIGSTALPSPSSITADARDGSPQILYPDGWIQRVGQTGPIEASYVCLLTRDGLVALDPVTGRTLWSRSNIAARSEVFGDSEYIYLVEMDASNNVTSTRALRAQDGVSVDVPDFAGPYARRQETLGRHLLLKETDDKNAVVLRLYNVLTGKDEWKQTFPADSQVISSEIAGLTGVCQPDGQLLVFDLNTRKEVLKASIDPTHLEKAESVYLVGDPLQMYVAINGPRDAQANPWGGPWSNLMPGSGMRSLPVNGMIYAFDRATGKMRRASEAKSQMLVVEQFESLPFVLLTARYQRAVGIGGNRVPQQGAAVMSIDKRTGKLLYDQSELPNGMLFYSLTKDLRAGKIELTGNSMKIIHFLPGTPVTMADNPPRQSQTANRAVLQPGIAIQIAPAAVPQPPVRIQIAPGVRPARAVPAQVPVVPKKP